MKIRNLATALILLASIIFTTSYAYAMDLTLTSGKLALGMTAFPPSDSLKITGCFVNTPLRDLRTVPVVVTVGNFTQTIPAGWFMADRSRMVFKYKGMAPGLTSVQINYKKYTYTIVAKNVPISGSSNPVAISLDCDYYLGCLKVLFAPANSLRTVWKATSLSPASPCDTVAPSIQITGPTSAATYSTSVSTLNLSGTASDNVALQGVSWSNDRGGSGTATGTTTWSITGIALQSGDNVITVTATDTSGNQSSDTITVTYSSQVSSVIGADGGTIEITDPASPIFGVKVVVPAGAMDLAETISVGYEDTLPGPVDNGIIAIGKVLKLTKDSDYTFIDPITVTMPYTIDQLDPGDIPSVFYWDQHYNRYAPVAIKELDTVNKKITFETIHFSNYVLLGIKGLAAILSGHVDTGFRPEVDGFFHPNFGAFDDPGGCCFGMANYSEWYYTYKKNADGSGLYNKYRQGDPSLWADDSIARELISRSYIASNQRWGSLCSLTGVLVGQDITGKLLLLDMAITKAPQTLMLRVFGKPVGHAVTVYGYDYDSNAGEGFFNIYDNNDPGIPHAIQWTPLEGFHDYDLAKAYGYNFNMFAFDALSSSFKPQDFEGFYDGAQAGWPLSKFNTISVVDPKLDPTDTVTLPDPNNITVKGVVTGGEKQASWLVYNVNGAAKGLGGNIVAVKADGSFEYTIDKLSSLNKNTIMMSTTDDSRDAKRARPNAYAGFKEFTIKVTPTFINMGFETGDFTAWTHETHTWYDTTPGSFTPEKSSIAGPGFDPIATTLPTTYKGSHAACVNNWDNDYHISSVSQSAVIPKDSVSTLEFRWAAVLEDPQHEPDAQPYVDILVTDDTASTVLYSEHFYTNDPLFSGWQSFMDGEWKAIPWRPAIVDISSAKEHQVTIKVTAADCAYGGHGGYVYLDADE